METGLMITLNPESLVEILVAINLTRKGSGKDCCDNLV